MFEDFYVRKINLPTQSGVKLRKMRLRKNKTVKDISNACNVTEASIRYYENCERQLTDERLKEIASVLEVDESALQDHQLNSVADIMHLLFDLEDAGMLIPVYIPEWDIFTVRIKNSVLRDAVKEWANNSKSMTMKEIDKDSYDRWRELFPSESLSQIATNDSTPITDAKPGTRGKITDFPYYILVTLLQLRQILTKNTKELEEFIATNGDAKVNYQYSALIRNSLGLIDTELGRIIEYAKVIEPTEAEQSTQPEPPLPITSTDVEIGESND